MLKHTNTDLGWCLGHLQIPLFSFVCSVQILQQGYQQYMYKKSIKHLLIKCHAQYTLLPAHIESLLIAHIVSKVTGHIIHRKHLFIPPSVSLCVDCRSTFPVHIGHNMQVFEVYKCFFHQKYFINYVSNIWIRPKSFCVSNSCSFLMLGITFL